MRMADGAVYPRRHFRSTEGSGLGLSIAKNLTEMQGGTFTVYVDGDLFKVMIEFPAR